MTITIYESLRTEAEKKLSALARRAAKIGASFSYSIGEAHPVEIVINEYDPYAFCVTRVDSYHVMGADVEISDELIHRAGWTCLARLEHFDNGNLVTRYTGEAFPEAWRTCPPYCEHCRSNRRRSVTYMVEHEDGSVRQVGSACLLEYTGIRPESAASFAAIITDLTGMEATAEHYNADREGGSLLSVQTILAHAADIIARKGYTPVSAPGSTADAVRDLLRHDTQPSDDGRRTAEEIIAWVLSDDVDRPSIAYDMRPLIAQEWCKGSHIGRLAYIPAEFKKYKARAAREAARAREKSELAASSKHVGAVGERMTFRIESFQHVAQWETAYGITHLYRFVNVDGNVLVWFASSVFGHWSNDGQHYIEEDPATVKAIKATVKDHTERDGIAQTVITRCKIA